MLRPDLTGRLGAVAAAHPLAVAAGTRLLQEGGTAVDAAIAAQAVLCVVMPNACGLGGDGLSLIADPDGLVTAVNGTGASPAADPPGRRAHDAGASVTVPGLVDAWATVTRRWGSRPLADTLAPAIALAADGVAADGELVAAARAHRGRLLRGGAAGWPVVVADRRGARLRQPALAAALEAVARTDGAELYRGALAEGIARAVQRDGGAMEPSDLAAHTTVVADPIGVPWRGGTAWVQPPMSQGVLLAMALNWLEGHDTPVDDDHREHVLVELTEAVFGHRDRAGLGAVLLREPLDVDRERAAGRGGPRAYLHTAGVAVADREGRVVSSLLSVFDDFGSATFVPEGGFTLNNRAGGFTQAPNDPAPGKRPVHTLAPALLTGADGLTAIATPGADGQVQTLLQVLARSVTGPDDLPAAIAAPRWRSEGGSLLVEASHPLRDELAARGHCVTLLPDGADRFGAVVCAGVRDGWPVAAGDWRRQVWAGAA